MSSPAPAPVSAKKSVAIPTLYVLLATVATYVQWNKWQALHRSRHLAALLVSLIILVIAATYLLRAFQAKRQAGQ